MRHGSGAQSTERKAQSGGAPQEKSEVQSPKSGEEIGRTLFLYLTSPGIASGGYAYGTRRNGRHLDRSFIVIPAYNLNGTVI